MKTLIITGANRGIGLAAARRLADAGNSLILLCRDEARGREALAELAPLPPPHEH
ncbi:MAG: SDR family NAD(P)-dependent oxidoreductase, partial [Gemmatimonadetes bacterium]|nr:SDR family NAD(P)-dependent oxidoreductase [Gemmatimonadota bacterium]